MFDEGPLNIKYRAMNGRRIVVKIEDAKLVTDRVRSLDTNGMEGRSQFDALCVYVDQKRKRRYLLGVDLTSESIPLVKEQMDLLSDERAPAREVIDTIDAIVASVKPDIESPEKRYWDPLSIEFIELY